MPAKKFFTREDILRAMKYSRSVRSASKYLGASYQHVKQYFKMYKVDEDDPNSKTLFETHLNRYSKGIPKFLPNSRREPNVKQIFEEGIGYESYTPEKIKIRGLAEGYLRDECYTCGCNERRITDFKTPTLMNFKDGNKSNYLIENLEILCYNCYFLYVADPLTNDQIRHIQDNTTVKAKPHDWNIEPKIDDNTSQLDEESLANMRALGIIQ